MNRVEVLGRAGEKTAVWSVAGREESSGLTTLVSCRGRRLALELTEKATLSRGNKRGDVPSKSRFFCMFTADVHVITCV